MLRFFQSAPNPHQKIVLLTGAAGSIGTSLRHELGADYHFRCLDRIRVPKVKDVRVVDINNFKAVLKAMRGVDAVIHLAANPNLNQSWGDVYTSGIGGTYNVLEAARQAGVKKIIYASTIHVSGCREVLKEKHIAPEQPLHPDSLYALGKVCGEVLGRFFVDRYEMSVVCFRIGLFENKPKLHNYNDYWLDHFLANWCSQRDLAQLVKRSLEHENLGFQIFYAISGNTRRYQDISNAQKLLGYEPQDNAENLIAETDAGDRGIV